MNKQIKGALYLIPIPIAENTNSTISNHVKDAIKNIRHFLAENPKTARRFLKLIDQDLKIESMHIETLDKRTQTMELANLMSPLISGENMGVISESGNPCIADPGSIAVNFAHNNAIQVIPLTGPSSILLALVASGLNGQNFTFNGYLPVQDPDLRKKLKSMEKLAWNINQTQIFMETPYRNNKMLKVLMATLSPEIRLCIASDITGQNQLIKTLQVNKWINNLPDIQKQPTIFLLGQ